jgi:uncharacterized membrane protein
MDVAMGQQKNERIPRPTTSNIDEYRESIRKLINDEIKSALEEEMKKAAQELMEEQRKAVRQILDEHKTAIRQIVEEEKKEIWEKAEALRKSILKVGL